MGKKYTIHRQDNVQSRDPDDPNCTVFVVMAEYSAEYDTKPAEVATVCFTEADAEDFVTAMRRMELPSFRAALVEELLFNNLNADRTWKSCKAWQRDLLVGHPVIGNVATGDDW